MNSDYYGRTIKLRQENNIITLKLNSNYFTIVLAGLRC